MPRPMAYKGTAHAWLRNIGRLDEHEDWTSEPRTHERRHQAQEELKEIRCAICTQRQSTENHKLNGKVGFSQIKCNACEEVSSAKEWLCMCRIRWYKCGKHVHKSIWREQSSTIICNMHGKGIKSKLLDRGVDRPMPKKVRLEGSFTGRTLQVETDKFLFPESTLAKRFPHCVK